MPRLLPLLALTAALAAPLTGCQPAAPAADVATTTTAATADPAAARAGIERSSQRFVEAMAAGDADAVAALYLPDAIVLPPGAPPVVGRDAIRADFAAMLASGGLVVTLTTDEVTRYGDDAVERATIAILADGKVVQTGKSLVVWRLVGGEWLYARDMYSWDTPDAAPAN